MDEYNLQVADNAGFTSLVINLNQAVTQYSANILNEGTQYYWRTRAYSDDCGWSGWSSTWDFTAECPLPNAPLLAVPPSGETNLVRPVNLQWNTVDGAINYKLQVADNFSFVEPLLETVTIDLNYDVDGLKDVTKYYWRVGTENDCGWGIWSNVWNFTTQCPAVGIITLIDPADGSLGVLQPISIDWEDILNIEKYEIQIDIAGDFLSLDKIDAEIEISAFISPLLTEGTTYYWRVRAYNGCQWSEWSSIWSFVTSEQTDIEMIDPFNIPGDYSLRQNYPNPFNPKTTIEFSIPGAEYVTLEIHNILGEKVASVVSQHLTAGHYSVSWDASEAPTGIYFYRIKAGDFIQTRKMILLK